MKFIKKISLIFCISIILLIGTAFAETGKINVSATRLREKNNTDSNILTNIYKDDTVEILEEAGDWYKVKYDGKTGYVKKEYVTASKNQTNTATNNENEVSENTVNSINANEKPNSAETPNNITNLLVNLRSIPSMTSRVFAQINVSQNLTELNELGNWVQVTDGNTTGWILKSKMTIPESNPPVQSSNFTNTLLDNTIANMVVENNTNTNTNTQTNTSKPTNTVSDNNTSNEKDINKTGIINVETAKVREKASSTAKVIDFLDYNDKVTIVAEDGEWYKITSPKSGYVNKKLVTISDDTLTSRSLTEERKVITDETTVNQETNDSLNQVFTNFNNGNKVADYAKQYLGYSYVVGGKTPESGFDCSGFTRYVYLNFGYNLGNTAASQTNIGVEISREDMQVGDLILFYNEGKTSIGHTGVYIGNGEFVHAANPDRGVVTDNINSNSYYNERFVSARRIVE